MLKYSKITVCTNTLLSAPTTNSETTMNPDFHEFFIQSDEQQYLKNQQTISRSWHAFTNFPNRNSPIFLRWKITNLLLVQKGFFEQLRKSKQILRDIWWKKIVDSKPENSWTHGVSSIQDLQNCFNRSKNRENPDS